jgi:hypothetical protein
VAAAGSAGFGDELLAAQLAEVVGALPNGVVAFGLPGEGAHLGGELGDGEAGGRDRQREHGGEGGTDAGLVNVDAADPGGADPEGCRQPIEDAVGDEADVDAVEPG